MWCGYAGVHACALSIRDVHFTGIRYIGYEGRAYTTKTDSQVVHGHVINNTHTL